MKNKLFLSVALFFTNIFGLIAQQTYSFQNVDLPIDQRVDNVISLFTLKDKAAYLLDYKVPRLNIASSGGAEGLHQALVKPPQIGAKPIPTASFSHMPDILHITHAAQEQGTVITDVLFGDYNQAGRLVQAWPKSLDQQPLMMDYYITNGPTYMYFKSEPLYHFGYGLSYTKFLYSNMKLSAAKMPKNGIIALVADIKSFDRQFFAESQAAKCFYSE